MTLCSYGVLELDIENSEVYSVFQGNNGENGGSNYKQEHAEESLVAVDKEDEH